MNNDPKHNPLACETPQLPLSAPDDHTSLGARKIKRTTFQLSTLTFRPRVYVHIHTFTGSCTPREVRFIARSVIVG